jgi:hypothetical protein
MCLSYLMPLVKVEIPFIQCEHFNEVEAFGKP